MSSEPVLGECQHPQALLIDDLVRSTKSDRWSIASDRNGFSTLDLLVTLGIVIILCALLLPGLNNAKERARKVKCQGVLHQVYVTTMLYASEHEDHMPSWGLFFKSNSVPPRCPSARTRLSPIEYGGYSWSPFPFGATNTLDQIQRNASMWMASDKMPWHDPKRTREPDRFWTGRVNMLFADGHLEWLRLTTPP